MFGQVSGCLQLGMWKSCHHVGDYRCLSSLCRIVSWSRRRDKWLRWVRSLPLHIALCSLMEQLLFGSRQDSQRQLRKNLILLPPATSGYVPLTRSSVLNIISQQQTVQVIWWCFYQTWTWFFFIIEVKYCLFCSLFYLEGLSHRWTFVYIIWWQVRITKGTSWWSEIARHYRAKFGKVKVVSHLTKLFAQKQSKNKIGPS